MKAAILHICKVYLPVRGGVQKVVHAMASLSKQHAHSVLTTGEDGAVRDQVIDGARVTRCRSYLEIASMPIAPSMLNEARRQIKLSDLLVVHYPFPLADLALMLAFKLPPLVVFWHSNIVAQKKLKWLTYPMVLLTLWRATTIVATSERMVENSSLLKRFRQKVRIIPYGLPALDVQKSIPETQNKYFILVGRHVSYKGIDVAIRAMQQLETQLIIAGDGPLFERHKLLATTLGVADKVSFVKDADDEQLIDLINGSLALILPSVKHNEAFALVQLEAMRLKKPVVNTWLPSTVPTIARDQKEGLTINPCDPDALAQAMSAIQSDKNWAAELGANGYRRFHEVYTEELFKHNINAMFDELLSSLS